MNTITPSPIAQPTAPAPMPPKYNVATFASAVRARFPGAVASDGTPYASMSDQELTNRMVQRYPVYSTQISDLNKSTAAPEKSLGQLDADQVTEGMASAENGIREAGSQLSADDRTSEDGYAPATARDELDRVGDLVHGAASAISGFGQAAFAPLTATAEKVSDAISDNPTVEHVMDSAPVSSAIEGAKHAIAPLAHAVEPVDKAATAAIAAHPRLTQAAADVASIGANAAGVGGGDELLDADMAKAPGVIKEAATDAKNSVANAVTNPKPTASLEAAAKAKAAQADAVKIVQDTMRTTANKYTNASAALHAAEVTNKTNPLEVLSSYSKGKALPTIESGKMNSNEAMDFLKQQVGRLGGMKSDAVALSDKSSTVAEQRNLAEKQIASQPWSKTKMDAARGQVKRIYDEIAESYGGENGKIPATELDKIKSEQTGLSKSYNNPGKGTFEYDAHGIVGKAARASVEDMTGDAPTRELNNWIASHYDAIKLLKTLNGKAPHGGQLTKMASRLGGEILGATAGTVVGHPFAGALAGRFGGDALDGLLHSHVVSNPLKRMAVKNMAGTTPDVEARMLQYLDDNTPTDGHPSDEHSSASPSTAPTDSNTVSKNSIKSAPRGFIRVGGTADTVADLKKNATAEQGQLEAQREQVAQGLGKLTSADFMKVGNDGKQRLNLPLFQEFDTLSTAIDRGQDTPEDIRQGAELLKLLGKGGDK